jgi:cyclic pyranopterin phosphate synthase
VNGEGDSGVPSNNFGGPRLVDSYGRVATDLRISVTDRCNFRCSYCMPDGHIDWMPRADLLTFEELARVASIFVQLGVKSIRLTGGEPLARAHLEKLVAGLRLLPIDDLALTTNGYALEKKAQALADAGLDRVNVSLDSLDRKRFAAITKVDALEAVLRGLRAARQAGLDPIKINCVVIRGVNDDEVVDFARFGRDNDFHVRFIELMPLDSSKMWRQSKVVTADEIIEAIAEEMELVPEISSGPAETYRFAESPKGSVGVIASVSKPFCDRCDRVRLTADGQLRSCLFALEETDLKSLLRSGCTDQEIASAISETVARKWAGHRIGASDFERPSRPMFAIGG